MTQDTSKTVGVDISKAHLDVHEWPSGRSKRFPNDTAGFQALARWIGPEVRCVVYESTGPWHRAMEEALAARLPLARVNAMRARRFAQALGQEAKTDAVDARILARMGEALPLRRVDVSSPTQRQLEELISARDGLVKDRTAARNRSHHARHPMVKRHLRQRLAQIERQIRALDGEFRKLLKADPALARKAEVLTSIPGMGPVTVAGLLSLMPELGQIDSKAVASLAGLAPVARESGTWKGRRFIRGGRHRVRRMLYMAALTAIRHNPDYIQKYRQLRERGKAPKVALTAIMRKMVILANVLLSQDRVWTPRPVRAVG
jgi:transposase